MSRAPTIVLALLLAACGGGATEVSTSASDERKADPTPDVTKTAEPDAPDPKEVEAPADCEACKDGECRPEDAKACHAQSEAYRWGDGVKFDMQTHGDFAELACNAGYMPDCSVLAMLYQDGIGGREHDDAKAAALHRKACDGGAGIGCFNLAMMIEAGGDGPVDPDRARPLYDKAIELLEKACNGDDLQWCTNVGYMYDAGHGVTQSHGKAIAAYQRSCPKHRNSCANLALMLFEGRGTAQDIPRGRKLLEDGCAADNMWSCAHLGNVLLIGRPGIEAEPEQAIGHLTKACERGHAFGCVSMALAHGMGKGVAQNYNLALDYAERACAIGDSSGCQMAVDELTSRPGGGGDPARMRGLAEAGCKIGSGRLCGGLGQLLAAGVGADKDVDAANVAFAEGCRRGDLYSCGEVVKAGGTPQVLPGDLPKLMSALCRSGLAEACAP